MPQGTNYGYQYGDPFGNPSQFTRSTQESEIDRFNQWMRSQPWWTGAQHNPAAVQQQLAAMGIRIPDSFHIDEAGNLNQKSRAGSVAKWAAIGGGAALGGLGLAGVGPLGLLGGGGAAAPELAGGASLAANLGPTSALPAFSASALPALEGGATLAANLGADSALPALSAAGAGGSIAETVGQALGHGKGSGMTAADLLKLLGAGGLAVYGATQNHGTAYPPELDQILALQKQRMAAQTPLYDSILKLSQSRLPTAVQG